MSAALVVLACLAPMGRASAERSDSGRVYRLPLYVGGPEGLWIVRFRAPSGWRVGRVAVGDSLSNKTPATITLEHIATRRQLQLCVIPSWFDFRDREKSVLAVSGKRNLQSGLTVNWLKSRPEVVPSFGYGEAIHVPVRGTDRQAHFEASCSDRDLQSCRAALRALLGSVTISLPAAKRVHR